MMDVLIQYCKGQSNHKHTPRFYNGRWRCFDGVNQMILASQCLNKAGDLILCPSAHGGYYTRDSAILQLIQENTSCDVDAHILTTAASPVFNSTELSKTASSNNDTISIHLHLLSLLIGAVLIAIVAVCWSCMKGNKTHIIHVGKSSSDSIDAEIGTGTPLGESPYYSSGTSSINQNENTEAVEMTNSSHNSGNGTTIDGLMKDIWSSTSGSDADIVAGYSQDADCVATTSDAGAFEKTRNTDVEHTSEGLFIDLSESEEEYEGMLYSSSQIYHSTTGDAENEGEGFTFDTHKQISE